jgi:hypothetical protein
MEALSEGFCAAALTQTLTATEVNAWQQQWPQPTLQVVDIQRYPRCPTAATGPCRFYVAASDGQSLIWMVVPPNTPLEEAIESFELEVGCCVTVLSHALVTAANGLNVVVPLCVKYTSNTLRLLGQPDGADLLFPLSPASLVQRSAGLEEAVVNATTSREPLRRPSHRIVVRDFVDNPEKALGNWSIAVRVVWRGHEYQMNSSSRPFGLSSVAAGTVTTSRYVFRCLLVDERGDGIVAAFFGGETLLDRVQLHDCLVLSQGTVKWGVGEVAAPVELQFVEKSLEAPLDLPDAQEVLPFYAAALVGEVAESLRSVAEVVATARVGDFTSVVGVVVAVLGSTQITTKRGRVSRSVVTLADGATGSHTPRSCVEVTLWGEVAESVEPVVGERWVFHGCAVQIFQQRKTLSSRASTMAVQLRSLLLPGSSSTDVPPPPANSVDDASSPTRVSAVATGCKLGTTTSHSSTPSIKHESKATQFVLDLHEASTSLPVLARVQEVSTPLLTWTCTTCWGPVAFDDDASRRNPDIIPERCAQCGEAELSPSFHLEVWVSDSLSTAPVAFHGSAAETLVGATAAELARALQRQPLVGMELRCHLVGVPLLMWLLHDSVGESGTAHYIAAASKHIDYTSSCHALLSALEVYTGAAEAEEASAS